MPMFAGFARKLARPSFVACTAVTVCAVLAPAAHAALGPVTEDSPANQLALTLNTVGEANYATTFTGVTPTDSADVTVYTTGDASAFLAYADSLAGSSVTITDVSVSRSISELNTITSQIASDVSKLSSSGIALQSWGPVPSQDDVNLVLAASPNNAAVATYAANAQATFNGMFGPGAVTVASQTQPLAQTTASRDADATPFSGGNGTFGATLGDNCTDSWEVKNGSGQIEVLSAGHCGPGTFYINNGARALGHTVVQDVGSSYDFETITANEQDKIWKNSTTRYTVIGSEDPGIGSTATVNGDMSGEHGDLRVTAQDACQVVTDHHYGQYTVCGLGEVSSSSPVCQPGDSGGPAYHSSGSNVDAIGTIESINNGGRNCFFEGVAYATRHANLTLVHS